MIADAGTTADEEDVGLGGEGGGQRVGGGGAGVADALVPVEVGVGLREQRGDEGRVAVADLAGGGRGVGRNQFAAGDQVGDAGAAGDEGLGGAERGEQRERTGVEALAGGEQLSAGAGLGAAAADVPGRRRLQEAESPVVGGLGVFLHDERGVCGRQRAAGEDAHGVAGGGEVGRGGAGRGAGGESDEAGGFVGAHEITVDGGAVEGRLVFGGDDGLAQDAVERGGERDAFGGQRTREGVELYPKVGDGGHRRVGGGEAGTGTALTARTPLRGSESRASSLPRRRLEPDGLMRGACRFSRWARLV